MKVFTFSEARQNFASVLDSAQQEGAVRITRRDGRTFTIQPVSGVPSPLAVNAASLKIKRADIISAIRESRERCGD